MKFFIRCVNVVGMHHYGQSNLVIDELFEFKHEPDNPYDKNAVTVLNMNGRKVAYLCKEDAACVSQLFKKGYTNQIFGKAKYPAEVRKRSKGPQQRVALGFFSDAQNLEDIIDIFKLTGAVVEHN